MDPDGGVERGSSLKLPHSHSTPAGVDGGSRTPPTTPKKGGKMLAVRVQMLDDSITMFQVQAKALGRVLFDQVCKQLHLLEADYFGLEYQEPNGTKYWLDLEKPLSRQVGLSLVDTLLRFCVKFYTPDPAQLEEEFTRYLFCLQIKRDLAQGLLQCNDNTAALMASYIVQAECGDYVVEDYPDHTYLSTYKFVPNQDHELERRIMENHKKHAGQSPAEADLNLLETSRRCELYGMKMHPAKDHEGVPLNLAVAHMGIVVFQNFTKINTFSWAKIRKISFKRKRFLVKLHPEGYGYYKDTVDFFFEGRNECKNFWKKCVENHGFFRCSAVKRVPRQKTRVLSRGSSFRYSGKTQKQIVEFVRENYVKRQTFQRSQSFRHSSSAHSSVANVVGTSLSAHPLLPLGDNAVVGTPASLSCGSMTLGSTMEHHRGLGSHSHHHHRHPSRDRAGNVSPLLSPTHTADIHDFDTRDLTIITAGGIGTTSPSPPLTTSLSPGTSITSSPQHFYPGGRQTDDEEQEYTTEQRGTPGTGGSQHQSPYRHQNTGQNSYGSTQSHQLPLHTLITTSLTQTTTHIITQHPTTLPRSNTNVNQPERKLSQPSTRPDWQRSASCRNLRNDSKFEKSGEDHLSDGRGFYESVYRQERLIESPITRYDDSRRTCYSAAGSKTNSVDRGSDTVPDTRIYSSSYPGTTSSLSTESGGGDEPGGMMEAGSECILLTTVDTGSQEEILYSHDDLSHDSYELLEREGEDEGDDEQEDDDDGRDVLRCRVKSYSGTRSCSLESGGDILPLDEIMKDGGDDVEVFEMDEIEPVVPQSYGINVGDYSTKTDRVGLDDRIREGRDIHIPVQVQSQYDGDFESREGDNEFVKSRSKNDIRDNEYIYKYPSVESEEEQKQAQAHFMEYNAKCKPGMVVGFDNRDEIGGKKILVASHTPVERAKSDPHTGSFRSKTGSKRKRRILTHQKSIDVTPAGSGESDEEVEGDESVTMTSSRSEYNIPYTLHKRHAMNGTAPVLETTVSAVPHQVEMLTDDYKAQKSEKKLSTESDKPTKAERKKTAEKRIAQQRQGSDSSSCKGSSFEAADHKPMMKKLDSAEKAARMLKSPQSSRESRKEMPEVIIISHGPGTDDDKISEAARKSDLFDVVQIIEEPRIEIIERPFRDKRTGMPEIYSKIFSSSDEEHADKPSTSRKSRMGPTSELLSRKRDRSPILFARARLGLSEGSAFSPVCQTGSPASSRRAKSLDAPVVSVHRLPPADAFSCTDDTLDNGIGKPLQIVAKRLPSTIEDENGIQEKHEAFDRQVKEDKLKKDIKPTKDSDMFLDKMTSPPDFSQTQQIETQGLPIGDTSTLMLSSEFSKITTEKPISSPLKDETVPVCEIKEFVIEEQLEKLPYQDMRPEEPLTSEEQALILGIKTKEPSKLKPEVPSKPANLKTLKGSVVILPESRIETPPVEIQHQFEDIQSQKQKVERVLGSEKYAEIYLKEVESLKPSQDKDSEEDIKQSGIIETVTDRQISPSVLKLSEREEAALKQSDTGSLVFDIDGDFKERKLVKGGSSGEYQTFDDIELPPEFRDHLFISEFPEEAAKESIKVDKSLGKYAASISIKLEEDKQELHESDIQLISEKKYHQVSSIKTKIRQAISSETKPKTLPTLKKIEPIVTVTVTASETESLPDSYTQREVYEKNVPAEVETVLPQTSKEEYVQPTIVKREKKVCKTDSLPKPASREGTPSPSKERGMCPGHHPIPHRASLKLKSMKREPVQIIRIDTDSPEREEIIVTSDDEVPAIPLDEEVTSLERWISVEDIHEELLAADHALKGALHLGHEFQYIDEDDRRSPDTCSDYDNLSSSSPSSHVLGHDLQLPLEHPEEFVEIELSKSKTKGQKEDTMKEICMKSIDGRTSAEGRIYGEGRAMIATEESDSTLSSTGIDSKSKVEKPEVTLAKTEFVQKDKSPTEGAVDEKESKSSLEHEVKAVIIRTEQKQTVKEQELKMTQSENAVKVNIEEKKDISVSSKPEQKPVTCDESPELLKDGRDEESPESCKDDKIVAERSKSEEEASTSSSLALPARVELSSTWRPFLLESSGSSSLEEGFFPPDEEETSSPSNNEREDGASAIDFPAFGYPCIGDVIAGVGGYGGPGVFALSRTLSRISERSTTSEQERSDVDDDSTKPSSRSPSVDDESLLSSDHQPSLSSDPPSGGPPVCDGARGLKPPDIHQDHSTESDTPAGLSPGNIYIPPPLLSDDDWPSPPTSSSMFETPVVSHVETFYMEIHPEEACKVLVIDSATDQNGGDGSSTDENHTLHDEDEDFLSGECLSSSATTLDGTVKVAVRPKCPSHYCAGSSLSEDTSMGLSLSEWSSSTSTVRPQCPLHYSGARSDDTSLDDLGKSIPDLPSSSKTPPTRSRSPSYYSGAKSDTCLDDSSPTRLGKPTSGQKSRSSYYSASKSLTSVDTSLDDIPSPMMSSERPVKVVRPKCTPYYSTARSDDGDRILERAISRQAMLEHDTSPQNIEAPAGWSDDRNIISPHPTGPKVRSKCYSYYSTAVAARSPQSDGDTSSSLDGSNVTERVSRAAPKRKKSQTKKRHRVTVDLEVRDGQIIEVSSTSAVETQTSSDQSQISTQGSAESPSAVMFVPKQSSV